MQMKRNKVLLYAGALVVAAVNSVQIARSAEAVKTYKVNISQVDKFGERLPSFIRMKIGDCDNGRRLESFEIDGSLGELIDVTVIVSGKNGRFFLGEGCKPFSNLNHSNLKLHLSIEDGVELVGDCSKLFYNSTSIYSIKFENVDTSRMTSMEEMFCLCSNISELDLRSFNTKNVDKEGMKFMFNSCPNLVKLNIASFTEEQKGVDGLLKMFCGNVYSKLPLEQQLGALRSIRCKFWLITDNVTCEKWVFKTEKHIGGSSSTTSKTIELEKNEDLKLENKTALEQKRNLPFLTTRKSNELPYKENKQVKIDKKAQSISNIRIEQSDSNTLVKDSKTSNMAKQTVAHEKKEVASAATVDVKQLFKQEKHWYSPVLKFFGWIKRSIMSWFR